MAETIHRESTLEGLALSKGCAVGKVCMFNENRHKTMPMYKVEGTGVDLEMVRIKRAMEISRGQLEEIRGKVEKNLGPAEAEIFVAHMMILDDPQLLDDIKKAIIEEGVNAEFAVSHVLDTYESKLLALDDEYIKARASDFGEIRRRLLDVMGDIRPTLQCDSGHCRRGRNRVIVADELTPSLTVDVDPDLTIAFVTEHGGVNSHAAILARALGIPAVSGLHGIREMVGCGTELLVDGESGKVVIWPSDDTMSSARSDDLQKRGVQEPVAPVDGFRVQANINWASDIEACVEMQAEGIGLYRTEFEIIAAGKLLSEDELFERYLAVAKAMAGKMVVFRLFDFGSDKKLPFMGIPEEENPSLGWRGSRFLLGKKDILRTQARALARTSVGGRVHVMYPMIIDAQQFLDMKQAFMDSICDIPFGVIRHGAMFEVPSACLQAEEIMAQADFASIGTNDLTQYLFAVDRENDYVSYDYNPDRPVFWKLIRSISAAAEQEGKPLSVCGELAGYPRFIDRLVNAGIHQVSVSPRRIPEVRHAVAEIKGLQVPGSPVTFSI